MISDLFVGVAESFISGLHQRGRRTLKDEIREFLASRRAKVTPGDVGLPVFGDDRRVPGLRREEVAVLAGVSVD